MHSAIAKKPAARMAAPAISSGSEIAKKPAANQQTDDDGPVPPNNDGPESSDEDCGAAGFFSLVPPMPQTMVDEVAEARLELQQE